MKNYAENAEIQWLLRISNWAFLPGDQLSSVPIYSLFFKLCISLGKMQTSSVSRNKSLFRQRPHDRDSAFSPGKYTYSAGCCVEDTCTQEHQTQRRWTLWQATTPDVIRSLLLWHADPEKKSRIQRSPNSKTRNAFVFPSEILISTLEIWTGTQRSAWCVLTKTLQRHDFLCQKDSPYFWPFLL